MFIFFASMHYYCFEKLKIVEKNREKLDCNKVSHVLNLPIDFVQKELNFFLFV